MRRALCVVTALLLSGCSSLNPINWFTGSSASPKPAELTQLASARPMRAVWQASVGAAGIFMFSPALADNSVFAAARDGGVMRLDAATGAVQWRGSAGAQLSGGIGTDGRLVAVGSDKGDAIVLDAKDGSIRWRARVSSEVLAAPVLADGLVLVRTVDSRIFAFSAEDGKRQWVYQRSAASLSVRAPAGMAVHEGNVYAGFSGGKLVAIALANGGTRWEVTVAQPKGATELERVTDISGDPVVQGREVCAGAYQGHVGCYDLATGNQVWTRQVSTLNGASLDARYAFVSEDRGAVHCLDRTNGRSVWKQDKLAYRELSRPLALGNEIAVGDLQGYVHLLARDSGAFVGRTATDGSPIRTAPLKLPAGFLVQTLRGGLYAFSL